MFPQLEPHGSDNKRQRMNSWCGMYARFNPQCPIHGRQALIEAYARDKLIQVNYESFFSLLVLNEGSKATATIAAFELILFYTFCKTGLYSVKEVWRWSTASCISRSLQAG